MPSSNIAKANEADRSQHGQYDSLGTVEIPDFAGARFVTKRYQRRTQLQYLVLAGVGLYGYFQAQDARLRVLGLSILFPGSGFIAVGGIVGIIGVIISVALFPLSLFAWFGAGGIAFVIFNWIAPAIIATLCAGQTIWEPSAIVAIAVVITVVGYTLIKASQRNSTALKLRQERNVYLRGEISDQSEKRSNVTTARQSELSLQDLRLLQRMVEIAYQAPDDFTNFDIIDQFQTAALRYQCYCMQWAIALVQHQYMPSFRGYMKESQERLIEKSLTEKVMNYWKWESLWGKFTMDWDPVIKDNIMVTGYLLLSLALYEKVNHDDRYRKKNGLRFDITPTRSYHHDTTSLMDALVRQWKESVYCLFPCEPNWIYPACNLVGMEGALAYDSYMQTGQAAQMLHDSFHRKFEEEFMNPDGSVVTIRSALTGFNIPGIAGVVGDAGAAAACISSMPNLARRLWLVSRKVTVRKNDNDGKHELHGLVGADNMDVGNYASSTGFANAACAFCAGEFGEEELQRDLLSRIDEEVNPLEMHNQETGSMKNEGLSNLASAFRVRASAVRAGSWRALIHSSPSENVMKGPKLARVPFPEVLVSRCQTTDGTDLSMVLHPGQKSGSFELEFADLKKGGKYRLAEQTVVADSDGFAKATITLVGRTELVLNFSR